MVGFIVFFFPGCASDDICGNLRVKSCPFGTRGTNTKILTHIPRHDEFHAICLEYLSTIHTPDAALTIALRRIVKPRHQNQNFWKVFTALPVRGSTERTLNRTVLLRGLHCPTVTISPSSTRNAGDTCAARLLCRFS